MDLNRREQMIPRAHAGGPVGLPQLQLNQRLRLAAASGSLEAVRDLISRGAEVNAVDKSGDTALSLAAAADEGAVCTMLVNAGAKIEQVDSMGRTPLGLAVARANAVSCEALIKAGANVNARERGGRSMIHLASVSNSPVVLQMLIDAGASVDVLDRSRESPLHCAATVDSVATARILVGLGLSPSYLPPLGGTFGLTPFQVAVQFGFLKVAKYFVSECGESMDQACADGRKMEELAPSPMVVEHLRSVEVAARVANAIDGAAIDVPSPRSRSLEPI